MRVKTILASTTKADHRTSYTYIAPVDGLAAKAKSFSLEKSKPGHTVGTLLDLPISQCKVIQAKDGYVSVQVPDWLYEKNKSFFE